MIKFKDLSGWLKAAIITAWIYGAITIYYVLLELFWTY